MEKELEIKTGCDRGLCKNAIGRQDRQLNTYDWLADVPGNADTTDLVEVQFKHTRKGYYHNVNNLPLKKGDIVAVEANPGHDIGVVTLTGRLVHMQLKKANLKSADDIRRIYRIARQTDIDKFKESKRLEHATMIESRQIAKNLGLKMKIGDVEYQGDGQKAIFYYIPSATSAVQTYRIQHARSRKLMNILIAIFLVYAKSIYNRQKHAIFRITTERNAHDLRITTCSRPPIRHFVHRHLFINASINKGTDGSL